MDEFTKIVPLFIVHLSFNKTTAMLLGVSVVVNCRIMYFEVYVVRWQSFI